jgi:hypothetical protein
VASLAGRSPSAEPRPGTRAVACKLNLRRGRAGLSSVVVWASEEEKQTPLARGDSVQPGPTHPPKLEPRLRRKPAPSPKLPPRSLRHKPPAEEFNAARDAEMRMHSEAAHHEVCWSCGQANGRHAPSFERNDWLEPGGGFFERATARTPRKFPREKRVSLHGGAKTAWFD